MRKKNKIQQNFKRNYEQQQQQQEEEQQGVVQIYRKQQQQQQQQLERLTKIKQKYVKTNTQISMANKIGETSPPQQQTQQHQQQQQQQYDTKNQCRNIGTTTGTVTHSGSNCRSANELLRINSSDSTNNTTNQNQSDVGTSTATLASSSPSSSSASELNLKRQQKSNILAHGKLNDLVADLCLNSTRGNINSEFNNSRLNNGAPDVFIDNINNCNLHTTVTVNNNNNNNNSNSNNTTTTTTALVTTSATTTTTSSSSSFSFKHFLSNSSRDMAAPSSTVTSLDPIIMPTNVNGDTNTETAAAANVTTTITTISATTKTITTNSGSISDPNKPFQTSTGARPKIPQSNSVSTTSICALMSNTRISDSSTSDHLGVGPSIKMKRSPRFSSFDSQASLAEYAGNSMPVQDSRFYYADGKPMRFYDSDHGSDGNYIHTYYQ